MNEALVKVGIYLLLAVAGFFSGWLFLGVNPIKVWRLVFALRAQRRAEAKQEADHGR